MDPLSATASPFTLLHSAGPQHEKALKSAFYNTAALVFVLISGVILVGAYFVLEAFLRPLIWASLCGAFIFPFKKGISKLVHNWLNTLNTDNIPLAVGLSLLPLQAVNETVDILGWIMKANAKLLVAVLAIFFAGFLLVVYQPYYYIYLGIELFHSVMSTMLIIFSYPLAVSM